MANEMDCYVETVFASFASMGCCLGVCGSSLGLFQRSDTGLAGAVSVGVLTACLKLAWAFKVESKTYMANEMDCYVETVFASFASMGCCLGVWGSSLGLFQRSDTGLAGAVSGGVLTACLKL